MCVSVLCPHVYYYILLYDVYNLGFRRTLLPQNGHAWEGCARSGARRTPGPGPGRGTKDLRRRPDPITQPLFTIKLLNSSISGSRRSGLRGSARTHPGADRAGGPVKHIYKIRSHAVPVHCCCSSVAASLQTALERETGRRL